MRKQIAGKKSSIANETQKSDWAAGSKMKKGK